MYSDLADFLTDLDRRALLAHITEPVSPNLEIAAVTDRACKLPGGGPALLFELDAETVLPIPRTLWSPFLPTSLSRKRGTAVYS